jgi:hypothetical protein
MKRMFIAGIVAGIVMFFWGAISHMVLQLGDAGLSQLKEQEPAVLNALKQNIKEPGLYFYPGFSSDHPDKAEQAAWVEKYRQGPAGLVLYLPGGNDPMTPKQFAIQIVADLVMGILAAALLAGTGCWMRSFISRVSFVALLGLLPFLAINLPYWNWYGFPTTFTMAQLADRFVGFVLMGIAIGAILKTPVGNAQPLETRGRNPDVAQPLAS